MIYHVVVRGLTLLMLGAGIAFILAGLLEYCMAVPVGQ